MNDLDNLRFQPFGAEDVSALQHFYSLRPNKSCDSAPLDSFLWRNYYHVQRCVVNDECLMLRMEENGTCFAAVPLCAEEKLPYYFRLQERYFNEVLHKPFQIYIADEEGVAVLKEAGALNAYDVNEETDLRDYLYEGDALRSLAGRKLSKKRGHIHKFEAAFEGRWAYRTLTRADRGDVLTQLTAWKRKKDQAGEGSGVAETGETFDAMESLDAEVVGIRDILQNDAVFDYVKIGGIFIDGVLKAFSIGNYNPREDMAVINIEKADPDIEGLYQVINQQFLLHEFPTAKLINREDDVGLEGLRQSKLSYYPIGYERKFALCQRYVPQS